MNLIASNPRDLSSFNSFIGGKKKQVPDATKAPEYIDPKSVSSNNPGATSVQNTTIAPPQKNPALSTPAAQQYTQSLQQTPSAPVGTPASSVTNTPAVSAPTSNPQSAYIKYLTGMFDADQLKKAQENLTALNERTASELKRNRERDYELRKNEIGQLERGQSYQLGEEERLSNRSLADLAIAKGANLDVYNQMINAGKSVYEAEQAQAESDRKNERYANETAYKKEQDIFNNDLATKKFEEDVRQFGLNYALSTQKAAQDAGNPVQAQQQKIEALQLAKELRQEGAVGKGSAVGSSFAKLVPFGQSLGLQGNRTAFEAKVDTLKSNLTLENLKLLKGAMSDKDLAFLNSIGSSLNVNMSEEQFNKELDKVINKLETATGSASNNQPASMQLPDGTVLYLQADGTYE